MSDPENTIEYWLGRYRAEGASPDKLREFLSTVSPNIPQAIAAREYIAEGERAQLAAQVSLSHAQSQPALDQAERHHHESLAETRRQSRRAEVVAWSALAVSVLALLLPWFHRHRDTNPTLVHPSAQVAVAPAQPTVAPSATALDPVKQLESLVHARSELKGFQFIDVKYDVEKTNSLTAPYTAVITGKHMWTENNQPKELTHFVLHAEYRNGEWRYTHSEGQTKYFENGDYTVTLSFDPAVDQGKFLVEDLHLKTED